MLLVFLGFFWLSLDVSLAVVAGWCSSLRIGSGVCASVCVCVVLAVLTAPPVRGDVLSSVPAQPGSARFRL